MRKRSASSRSSARARAVSPPAPAAARASVAAAAAALPLPPPASLSPMASVSASLLVALPRAFSTAWSSSAAAVSCCSVLPIPRYNATCSDSPGPAGAVRSRGRALRGAPSQAGAGRCGEHRHKQRQGAAGSTRQGAAGSTVTSSGRALRGAPQRWDRTVWLCVKRRHRRMEGIVSVVAKRSV
eukprot:364453-Chlamydomonas_euryale.AAC.12